MTKVYVDDTVYTVTVASAASDTQVITSGSGTSLINTSTGGITTLNSVTGGANVTITDDNNGNLTIAATEDNLANNSTSDLPEGSNLYFTDARVMTSLATVSGDIIPDADNTRSLGSATKEWKEVFIGPGSLYIDGHKVLGSDDTDTINVSTDTGQTLDISAGGSTGTAGAVNIASRSNVTTLNDTTVNLGPSVGGGSINVRGTLEAPDLHVADLEFAGNKIDSTASNGNLEIATNGTGYLHLNAADVYVGPVNGAVKIDESSITTTAGNLTISATGTVDVAGHYTSAETDSAISTATAALVDSAPGTLNTLNELAAALGDDANYATTTATSIGTKLATADFTSTANTWVGTKDTGALSEGSNLYHTTARAIAAVEGESTLNLTGTVKVGDIEVSNYSAFGENFGKINATGTNQNLMLEASNGTGYFLVKSANQYLGAASGVKITNAAGAATTLSGFGYQSEALNITGNLTGPVVGNVTGNLQGNVTGNVTGNLTANATTENLTTKNVKANPTSLTIPAVPNMGGWNYSADTGHALVGIGKFMTGHPIVGITQTDNVNESQPKSMFLVNHMDYDHSGSGNALGGHGVSVDFNIQDEAGNLHQLGQNLVKLRNVTTGGSAGSSTITGYDTEYTLSVKAYGTAGPTNALTSNKDFTEVAEELRVVNKAVNSGDTNLSGVYLTYNGAETGTPSALLQLRDKDDDENTENIKLEQARTTFGTVAKMHTLSADPSSAEAGDFYFNSTTGKFKGYNGSAWVNFHG